MRDIEAGQAAPISVVIAIKQLRRAKTRLAPILCDAERESLVLAMLTDTIFAILAAPDVDSVTVVTPDEKAARAAGRLGAKILVDPTLPSHHDPLNAALEAADTVVRAQARNVAVLHGDLPALRTDELIRAITAARFHRRSFVADRFATGTTALLAFGVPLNPLFGRGSAQRHALHGAIPLRGDWPGLQCDVDTPQDLAAALQLGVGHATRRTVERVAAYPTHQGSLRGGVLMNGPLA